MSERETPYFPLFINLEKKKILVFGAGKVALRRVRTLTSFHPSVTVITREIPEELREAWEELKKNGHVVVKKKAFAPDDLKSDPDDLKGDPDASPFFVLAATNEPEVNREITMHCRERGILVNNVSDVSQCDFYFPAVAFGREIVAGVTGNGRNHREVAEKAARIRTCLERADEENNQDRQQGE